MEAVEQGADARDEAIDGSCWIVSQQRLELGERHLDGVQIRAVGRQVEELGAARRDSLADAGDPMSWQVVEHDNIAAFEGRSEDLMDVDRKASPSIGPSSTHGAVMPLRRKPAMKVMVFQ